MSQVKRKQFLDQIQVVMTQIAELSERAEVLVQIAADREYEGVDEKEPETLITVKSTPEEVAIAAERSARNASKVSGAELSAYGVDEVALKLALEMLRVIAGMRSSMNESRKAMNQWRNV